MFMKGYALGYLGIPLNFEEMSNLFRTIGFYEEWLEMGTLTKENIIYIIQRALKKIKSYHNRSGSSQDYSKSIYDFS